MMTSLFLLPERKVILFLYFFTTTWQIQGIHSSWLGPILLFIRDVHCFFYKKNCAFLLFDHRLFAFIFLLKLSRQLTALRLSLSVDICTVCTKFPGRLKINILFQKCWAERRPLRQPRRPQRRWGGRRRGQPARPLWPPTRSRSCTGWQGRCWARGLTPVSRHVSTSTPRWGAPGLCTHVQCITGFVIGRVRGEDHRQDRAHPQQE